VYEIDDVQELFASHVLFVELFTKFNLTEVRKYNLWNKLGLSIIGLKVNQVN